LPVQLHDSKGSLLHKEHLSPAEGAPLSASPLYSLGLKKAAAAAVCKYAVLSLWFVPSRAVH